MPTKIREIFNEFDLELTGQMSWGQEINANKCGLYFVSITDNPDELKCWENPDFNENEIENWIDLVQKCWKRIKVDNKIASKSDLLNRLNNLWLPDETILYIGKAGPTKTRTVGKRVKEYFNTRLGCNKKHAGGNWINTLSKLNELTVFYSEFETDKYYKIEEIETQLIEYFSKNVSNETKDRLIDKKNCFPFANKEIHYKEKKKKIRKNHGLSNQTIDCASNWNKNNS
jgi:hypothetical protein